MWVGYVQTSSSYCYKRKEKMSSGLPASVADAVLQNSGGLPEGVTETIKGYDFNEGIPSLSTFLKSYATTGFQASALAAAIDEIQRMVFLFLVSLFIFHALIFINMNS